jgi:cytochrome oxidase Cu insertion factor (SCO1/SenC/PrrC family)
LADPVQAEKITLAGNSSRPARHYYYMMSSRLRRALLAAVLAAVLAVFALAALAPAARADGDPGSDVLVYQNLFVAADANISVPQQVQLGDLLSAADTAGFPIRVAIISQPDDLGAITALWQKPAAYASFLGTELSLSYAQRLLIVMPNGFGFNWQGHSAAAANRLLDGLHIGPGGSGLATAAETAVQALARASGIRLAIPASGSAAGSASAASGSASGGGASGAGAGSSSGGSAAPASAPSSSQLPLLAGIALAVLLGVAAACWLAWRAGLRRPNEALNVAKKLPSRLRLHFRLKAPDPGATAAGGVAVREVAAGEVAGGETRPQQRRRLAIPGTWIAGGFVGLAALAIVLHAVVQPSGSPALASTNQQSALTANPNVDPGATLSGAAPGFTLTDQFGQPVSLSSFRGKVVVLAFNDAECTTICPLTTAALVDAKDMLGAAGSQVQLVGVDANPKATAVEDVMSYSQLHGMLYQWDYLTGSLAQLQSVWKAYSVGVTISENQTDHEPAIFVINSRGMLVKLYLTQLAYTAVGQLGQLLAQEVSTLLPSHPAVNSHLSFAAINGISPAADTTLPAAGGGYVSLGPGQAGQGSPRLYLFFATWDQEITSLGGELETLNAYQSTAAANRLPGLTAVDEGSVEPSASALPDFLAAETQPLSYPVAIDDSGQVADGYGVQGVPWFVLTSADGKVLWSREVSVSGWPSTAALDKDVRAALAQAAKSPG